MIVKAQAVHGQIHLKIKDASPFSVQLKAVLDRDDALQAIRSLAEAYQMSGDMCDPFAVRLRESIEEIMKERP